MVRHQNELVPLYFKVVLYGGRTNSEVAVWLIVSLCRRKSKRNFRENHKSQFSRFGHHHIIRTCLVLLIHRRQQQIQFRGVPCPAPPLLIKHFLHHDSSVMAVLSVVSSSWSSSKSTTQDIVPT